MGFDQIRRRLHERRTDAGFSIVEVAVTVGVFSIVMTMIFGTVISVMNASNAFKERTQEQADTRLAIDTLVRDLRQAYTGETTQPSVDFTTSNATTITFYSPDRATDFRLRKIVYVKTVAGVLTRSATSSNEVASALTGTTVWTFPASAPAVAVLTGVTNATVFTYLDSQNLPTTTNVLLRAVILDLVIDQSPNAPPAAQPYHTQVDLRVTNNGG